MGGSTLSVKLVARGSLHIKDRVWVFVESGSVNEFTISSPEFCKTCKYHHKPMSKYWCTNLVIVNAMFDKMRAVPWSYRLKINDGAWCPAGELIPKEPVLDWLFEEDR